MTHGVCFNENEPPIIFSHIMKRKLVFINKKNKLLLNIITEENIFPGNRCATIL